MSEGAVAECTGQCCAAFTLSTCAFLAMAQGEEEHFFILDMIRSLTPAEAIERVERVAREVPADWPPSGEMLFTCAHWDPESKLCGAYDRRPEMCSKYPYGSTCRHCGGAVASA